MSLLELVKKHLRITSDVMDDEVSALISAALCDMKMRGIDTGKVCPKRATASGMNPLAVRAVIFYCKANFGVAGSVSESEQYQSRYDGLTQCMSHSGEYMLS